MSNNMKIFVTIICLSVVTYYSYIFINDKIEDKNIIQKFGSLNDIKLEEVETLSYEELNKQYGVYSDLQYFLRDDFKKEKTKKVESLLSRFYKIKNKWYDIIKKREAEVIKKQNERKRRIKKDHEKERYELFLKEMKGITDENIIKQRLEIYEKTDKLAKEDDDKELWDKFFKKHDVY